MPMWAHRPWYTSGALPKCKVGEELASYSSVFGAVEGNTTFYASPSPKSVEKWRDLTSESFRFIFKLPQDITHRLRLNGAFREYMAFLQLMAPLGERVGSVTAQLPASFGPDDLGTLDEFLTNASSHHRHSVELRHPAFFADGDARRTVIDLLRRHDADWVHLDSRALAAGPIETPEDHDAFDRKPRLPVRPIATGHTPIARFIGSRDLVVDETFFPKWTAKVHDWLDEGLDPVVFFHTSNNTDAPVLARRFAIALNRPAAIFPATAPHETVTDKPPSLLQ
jgi:uncharacterized protein YecE (DUF72 family)